MNYLVTGNLRSGMSQVLRGKLSADPSEPCVGDVQVWFTSQVRLGGARACDVQNRALYKLKVYKLKFKFINFQIFRSSK